MKESSKIAIGVVVVLFVALLGVLLFRQPAVSDQDQIAAQIESARAAAQGHSVDGIMNIVSADFKGPDPISNGDRLNLSLRRVLNDSGKVHVTMSLPEVIVHGDTATSRSQITVKDLETSQNQINQPLILLWRREDGRRYLVFPSKVWRVVGAQYQGDLAGFD